MVVEYPRRPAGPARLLIQTARDVINTEPDCYRPYDLICVNGDFGDVQMATASAAPSFSKLFPVKLRTIVDIARFREEAARSRRRRNHALVHQLEQAGRAGHDAGEPSWERASAPCQETQFVHVFPSIAALIAFVWNGAGGRILRCRPPARCRTPLASPCSRATCCQGTKGDRTYGSRRPSGSPHQHRADREVPAVDALRDLDLPAGFIAGRKRPLPHRSILAREHFAAVAAEDFRPMIETIERPILVVYLLNISPYSAPTRPWRP